MTNENKDSQLQLRLYKIAVEALARQRPSLARLAAVCRIGADYVDNHLPAEQKGANLISAVHQLPPLRKGEDKIVTLCRGMSLNELSGILNNETTGGYFWTPDFKKSEWYATQTRGGVIVQVVTFSRLVKFEVPSLNEVWLDTVEAIPECIRSGRLFVFRRGLFGWRKLSAKAIERVKKRKIECETRKIKGEKQ